MVGRESVFTGHFSGLFHTYTEVSFFKYISTVVMSLFLLANPTQTSNISYCTYSLYVQLVFYGLKKEKIQTEGSTTEDDHNRQHFYC